MKNTTLVKMLKCYGPDHEICYVRFVPTAWTSGTVLVDLTLATSEAQGVLSVGQTAVGLWTITFGKKYKSIVPLSVAPVENDTTVYHFVRMESSAATSGTCVISHKAIAYASVASGPALSDTVDELYASFLCRKVS